MGFDPDISDKAIENVLDALDKAVTHAEWERMRTAASVTSAISLSVIASCLADFHRNIVGGKNPTTIGAIEILEDIEKHLRHLGD